MQKTQERFSVTLRVMRVFSVLPGAPRACMFFRDPTDVSRIIQQVVFPRKLAEWLPTFMLYPGYSWTREV